MPLRYQCDYGPCKRQLPPEETDAKWVKREYLDGRKMFCDEGCARDYEQWLTIKDSTVYSDYCGPNVDQLKAWGAW